MFLYNGSNFEMSHGRPELPILSHTATPASGARGDHIFLLGLVASGRAWRLMASTPQARLITLIAASGKRSVGGGSGSSGKRRSGGGGAAAAAVVGLTPRAFDAERTAAPILVTIEADDLYTVFDPDGLNKQWTVNEVMRVKQALPNMQLTFAVTDPAPTVVALDRAVFEGGYSDSTSALVERRRDGRQPRLCSAWRCDEWFGLSLVGAGAGPRDRIQGASDAYVCFV